MKKIINIKLNKNETKIEISEKATYEEIEKELKEKIKELKSFYKEEKVPIFVTGKVLKNQEIEDIKTIIKRAIDVDVIIDSPEELGLHGIKRTYNKEINIAETQYYKMSLRSGQKIENESSIVILGDVNSGAEVISGENIVIVGALRGLAHAGAKGNKKAFIAASKIDTPQLRIANIVKEFEKVEDEDKEKEKEKGRYAFIENDEIIIE